ncbi:MAG: hypothetical protein GY792_27345, partial [Gammaproteobacteria bacterium]|nr:hypothetical protein [Gammaproteobacteria bacterium]
VIKTRERIAPATPATLRKQAKEIISIIFGLIKATYQKEGKSFREDPGIYDTST